MSTKKHSGKKKPAVKNKKDGKKLRSKQKLERAQTLRFFQ